MSMIVKQHQIYYFLIGNVDHLKCLVPDTALWLGLLSLSAMRGGPGVLSGRTYPHSATPMHEGTHFSAVRGRGKGKRLKD